MLCIYFYDHATNKIYFDADLSRKDEYLKDPRNLLWIDIYDCTAKDLELLANAFQFHPMALEDVLQESPRAKVDRYDDYYFFVFHSLRYDEESDEEITTVELDVFLGSNYLVTIHKDALSSVARVVKQCWYTSRLMQRGPDYLLYNLVDGIIDEYFPILERIGVRIDELEDELYVNPIQEVTDEFLALKRTILLLRKVIMPQRRIFANVNGRYSFQIQEENKPYYMDLVDNIERIIDTTDTYRDLVNGAMDTYYSIVSNRTNEVMRYLTIISTIMMPLTFITGLFGMNVPLPGAHSPYTLYIILLGMLGLTVIMLWYFRNKDWV
ncbi:MAG: magnesium/cobalt transporter CorA [Bacillota bacterium]|uniref:Magnesium transport protein CorA n=2 Tax=Carboxydocella TaxID=178898 RepID=A0A1T4NVU6_9FIRM|nr:MULTISPECIES: magnesium/cobalt transporter CorA [Carboxydocella]AVX20161.1 magnesium transporter [Carboxydocella thermautotrophica]AVX30580.1 magnesium transporter [Carboxydocella thermautotrophica]SJZ83353.1 magnesium transporter [Carboxydocella sporoproducens DSM 16521]GAW28424.1 magnesium and cobalt transport protein CorA [Carboxydocella sp. ULO1]GAW30824.1 magnesium and cobalt transport protein CorA [Carboxydocella sp. JDF658]